jgi:phage-related protein
MAKQPIRSPLRVNTWAVVQRAVEEGCAYGARRAFKHTDAPTSEQIEDACTRAVIDALCEVLLFDDPEREG